MSCSGILLRSRHPLHRESEGVSWVEIHQVLLWILDGNTVNWDRKARFPVWTLTGQRPMVKTGIEQQELRVIVGVRESVVGSRIWWEGKKNRQRRHRRVIIAPLAKKKMGSRGGYPSSQWGYTGDGSDEASVFRCVIYSLFVCFYYICFILFPFNALSCVGRIFLYGELVGNALPSSELTLVCCCHFFDRHPVPYWTYSLR